MKIVWILLAIALLLVGAVHGMGTDDIDRRPVGELDADRFMGDWYEIARYDNPLERGLVEVKTTCRRCGEREIALVGCGVDSHTDRSKVFRARVRLTSTVGRVRIASFLFFFKDYYVLELDPDYRWAVIGTRSANRLWLLSRTPRLAGITYNRIMRLIERRGYRSRKLLFVEQRVERLQPAAERENAGSRSVPPQM